MAIASVYDLFTRNLSYASIAPKPELREPVPVDQIARSVRNGSRWRAALVAGLAGMATTTTTTQGSGTFNTSTGGSGTFQGTATTTSPDSATTQRAAADLSRIHGRAEQRSQDLLASALRDNSVFAGSEVSGFVYFKRDRGHDASCILRVIIGALSIEFPVKW